MNSLVSFGCLTTAQSFPWNSAYPLQHNVKLTNTKYTNKRQIAKAVHRHTCGLEAKKYLERDVLVRWAGVEPEDSEARMVRFLQVVCRCLLTVDEVRVEHVELVTLE